jgi:hypothetical protein
VLVEVTGQTGTAAPGPPGESPGLVPADDHMREALEVAAEQAEETGGLGRPGRPSTGGRRFSSG